MEDEKRPEKLEVIASYLTRELGMAVAAWIQDAGTLDYVFRVDDERGVPRYWLRIARNNLDDHRVVEIEPILERQRVIQRLKSGEDPVRVTHPELAPPRNS